MTLIEAIQSGKPFRRPNDRHSYVVDKDSGYIVEDLRGMKLLFPPTVENITATDWLLEEEEV